MINAKEKFREGFIMMKVPHEFHEIDFVFQKFTIIYAYSEQSIFRKELSEKGKIKLEDAENDSYIFKGNLFISVEERKADAMKKIIDDLSNYENVYKGEIVQCSYKGQTFRLYPQEYSIMTNESLFEALAEEGYHTICDPAIYKLKEFKDRLHYIQSRGISKKDAMRWISFAFKDLVIYKPYFELLNMFSRPHEIIVDNFYILHEGISIDDFPDWDKDDIRKPKISMYEND